MAIKTKSKQYFFDSDNSGGTPERLKEGQEMAVALIAKSKAFVLVAIDRDGKGIGTMYAADMDIYPLVQILNQTGVDICAGAVRHLERIKKDLDKHH